MPYNDGQYKLNATEILSKTDGGLQIILSYYPQAAEVASGTKKFFKAHEEKSASARVTQTNDGTWILTDFGNTEYNNRSVNAIEIVRHQEGLGFKEALEFIVREFNLDIEGANVPDIKAEVEKRKPEANEEEGKTYFQIKTDGKSEEPYFSDDDLGVLGPFVTAAHCKDLNIYPLKSFVRVKDREALEVRAKHDFPIMMIDEGEFQKIYQPKVKDKSFRFQYSGKKPKKHIFGMERCRVAFEQLQEDWRNNLQEDEDNITAPKLPKIFWCMGDRDAVNVYSLDPNYYVIWLNSESATLTGQEFRKIREMCDEFYQVPDLDATGVKHGRDIALKFLEIKTVWLPDRLKDLRDFRGNICKDVTDYVKRWDQKRVKKEFKELADIAPTAKFWDEKFKKNPSGKYELDKYNYNITHAYYFMSLLGYYRLKDPEGNIEDKLIHIDNNVVQELEDPQVVKDAVINFLKERRKDTKLMNMVRVSPYLSEGYIRQLDTTFIDFTAHGPGFQYLFFQNKTWRISEHGIEEFLPAQVSRFVWQQKVVPHRVKKVDPLFTITGKTYDDFDIDVHNENCLFLNYLIQTSRMHWRKELESKMDELTEHEAEIYQEKHKFDIAGPALDPDEVHEQKLHLINKIYAIGYLLHRYKDPAKPWCLFCMDGRISDNGESNGGSGKSIFANSLSTFMRKVDLNGKNKKLTLNSHVLENVTIHTDYILIDDLDEYFDFGFFYPIITGPTDVNPKGTKSFTIPFSESPKLLLTSNHTLRNIGGSTQRRLLYTVFSDYYHDNESGQYNESRSPFDDFGKRLMDDFDKNDWNLFLNFMAQCVQFYLSQSSKINPPMGQVRQRNMKAIAGDDFIQWADLYFDGQFGVEVEKVKAYEDFKTASGKNNWSSKRITTSLEAWIEYRGYDLNPDSMCNIPPEHNHRRGRITKKFNGKTTEFIVVVKSEDSAIVDNEASSWINNEQEEIDF